MIFWYNDSKFLKDTQQASSKVKGRPAGPHGSVSAQLNRNLVRPGQLSPVGDSGSLSHIVRLTRFPDQ